MATAHTAFFILFLIFDTYLDLTKLQNYACNGPGHFEATSSHCSFYYPLNSNKQLINQQRLPKANQLKINIYFSYLN